MNCKNKTHKNKTQKRKIKQKQASDIVGGRGVLTDIAIPAILLYANNSIGKKIKQNKTTWNKKKRVRFSRKTRKLFL